MASAVVILYNKWILSVWGFNFPITLTMWHMGFCSAVAFVLVRGGAAGRGGAARGGAARARRGCRRGADRHCLAHAHRVRRYKPRRWRTWP